MPDPIDLLYEKARRVRLVCTDVDGVLTDGGMYYSEKGDELKKFNTRDGMGIARLRAAGIEVAMITQEETRLVAARAAKLGVQHLFQGARDKGWVVEKLREKLGLARDEVAYIGDDINDLPVLCSVGLSATVSDGLATVREMVSYVSSLPGGGGAFREFAELILRSKGVAER